MDTEQDEVLARNSASSNEEIDLFWHLADDFRVTDAAALIAKYDPNVVEKCRNNNDFDQDYPRYTIAFKAMKNSIVNGKLQASIRYSAREYGHADAIADMEYMEAGWIFSCTWHISRGRRTISKG